MSELNIKKKVIFAPGVLEDMEQQMDPEELQELLDQIKIAAEDGSLFEKSTLVDLTELQEEEPELYQLLKERLVDAELKYESVENRLLH